MEATPAKLVWKDIIAPQPPPESLLDPLALGLVALVVTIAAALAWTRWRQPRTRARMQLRRLAYQLRTGRLAPRAAAQAIHRRLGQGLQHIHPDTFSPPSAQRAEWLEFRTALLKACYAAQDPGSEAVLRLCHTAGRWLDTREPRP